MNLNMFLVCALPSVRGRCRGLFHVWHYNNKKKECTTFVYGGCAGNDNKFNTKEDCMELCV